jgi:uncharacterized membrane protein (Fun14 family)
VLARVDDEQHSSRAARLFYRCAPSLKRRSGIARVIGTILSIAGPFLIGFLLGAAVKRALRAALVIIALAIALVALGYVKPAQLASAAQQLYPALKQLVAALRETLPYSSAAFLAGLALGLWRG